MILHSDKGFVDMIIRIVYLLICIPVAHILNMVLHELGHALFSVVTGYRLVGIQVGNGFPLYDEKTGVGTDGHKLYNMLRDADIRRFGWCWNYITGMEYSGIRFKDIPEKYYLLYEQCDVIKLGGIRSKILSYGVSD